MARSAPTNPIVPERWIVNVRDDCVEVRRNPEPEGRRYVNIALARRGETIEIAALPGIPISRRRSPAYAAGFCFSSTMLPSGSST